MELQIVYLSPHDLTPYEGNARKHGPLDIEQIKESIRVDGFNDPIGIWGDNNLIVEGHGRQLAAIELGMDKVPCIRLDHMTDAQRRDYAIRHNRTAELSEWDWVKVESEIRELESEGMDLDGLDFDFENISSGGGRFTVFYCRRRPAGAAGSPHSKAGRYMEIRRPSAHVWRQHGQKSVVRAHGR